MSRKSTTKSKSMKQSSTPSQQLEKSLMSLPGLLAAQFSKEIAALKQTESKLKATALKFKSQIHKASTRAKAAAATKSLNSTSKQLQEITKALAVVSNKQAKMLAARKILSQFEKDWTKKSKAVAKKAAAKKPAPKKSTSAKKRTKSSKSNIVTLQQPIAVDSYDSSTDNSALSSKTEAST